MLLTMKEKQDLFVKKKTHLSLDDLNKELFNAFLKENITLETALNRYGKTVVFPRCNESFNRRYIRRMYYKFKDKDEKKLRTDGFDIRHKNYVDVILSRFVLNGDYFAYLPQIKISKLLKCNQKTVSRYITKMVNDGLITLDKKYKHYERKASEFTLTKKGFERVKTITNSYIADRILTRMFKLTSSIMDFGEEADRISEKESKEIILDIKSLMYEKKIYQTKRYQGNVSLYAPDGGLKNVERA